MVFGRENFFACTPELSLDVTLTMLLVYSDDTT